MASRGRGALGPSCRGRHRPSGSGHHSDWSPSPLPSLPTTTTYNLSQCTNITLGTANNNHNNNTNNDNNTLSAGQKQLLRNVLGWMVFLGHLHYIPDLTVLLNNRYVL